MITGAADDDPSGISTYSVTGAAFGYAPLWTALFSFPLMVAVQLMCARLGMVTGEGLAGVIRRRYPRWVLWSACALLVVANTVNIGADLGGMAKVTEMVTGIKSMYWTPVYAVIIGSFLIWSSYYTIARIFKWMTLVLFSYVLTAFFAKPDWAAVLRSTFIPHVEWSGTYWATLVGIFGTTISPYLFFWQASQEVEEERDQGKLTVRGAEGRHRLRIAKLEKRRRYRHVLLESDHVLHHPDDCGDVACPRQDDHFDSAGCSRGVAATGRERRLLAFQPGPDWRGHARRAGARRIQRVCHLRRRGLAGIAGRPRQRLSRGFYGVIAVGFVLGLALDYAGFNAVSMLFWSAVLNGVLAPPLIVIVLLLTSNPKVMGKRRTRDGWRCWAGSR